jgi:hypothetical protein
LSNLVGTQIERVEVILGEVYLTYATGPTVRISAVHWLLTIDERLVTSSLLRPEPKPLHAALTRALQGQNTEAVSVAESLALTISTTRTGRFVTLPFEDAGRQARLGSTQWSYESPAGSITASAWGKLTESSPGESIDEPDFAEGRKPEERDLIERVADLVRSEYGARLVTEGREFQGPDLVFVEPNGRMIAVELKLGSARQGHVEQMVRYLSNESSPAYHAQGILVVEREASPELRKLAERRGIDLITVNELATRPPKLK